MKAITRTETDSMGPMQIPAEAYYGAQTARALLNFPVSGLRFPRSFIRALGLVKKHAAVTNLRLGLLNEDVARAIQIASEEVIQGKWDGEFLLDIFQTGSGTSTNMNANEVIANRAAEVLGAARGQERVHPNDDVNRGQSSNDVIPTAIHVAAMDRLECHILPGLRQLQASLEAKAQDFWGILKIGRTHLQDATPIRLGQEFSGYASQVAHGIARLRAAQPHLCELALGGTAVGTGINTHPDFARMVIDGMAREAGLPLREAPNHFEAQAAIDACVEASGALRTVAVSLVKIANDVRWLGSGPRCGLGELVIPATQPGSSIMPGKVNPVMSEMLIQVSAQVVGNDAAIALAATMGAFELNTMLPVTAHNLLQSIELLGSGASLFAERCVDGLQPNAEKCEANLEQSLAMCTALAPVVGYDKAAEVAKRAFQTGRTVREVARELKLLPEAQLEALLDPVSQTAPGQVSQNPAAG